MCCGGDKEVNEKMKLLKNGTMPLIWVMGAPGAGKSTVSSHLADRFCLAYIDTKAAVNMEAMTNSKLGRKVYEALEKQTTIPAILEDTIRYSITSENGYVIDGFPRTADQGRRFQKKMGRPGALVFLKLCKKRTMRERCTQVMPREYKVFKTTERPPDLKTDNVRYGSTVEAVRVHRLKFETELGNYKNNIDGICKAFQQILIQINAAKKEKKVLADVVRRVKRYVDLGTCKNVQETISTSSMIKTKKSKSPGGKRRKVKGTGKVKGAAAGTAKGKEKGKEKP